MIMAHNQTMHWIRRAERLWRKHGLVSTCFWRSSQFLLPSDGERYAAEKGDSK